MGTDIHPIVQVKENGTWKFNIDKIFPNPDYLMYKRWRERDIAEGKPEDEVQKIPEWALEEHTEYPNSNRHYDWFAVLADVRNGSGFAGIKTGEGFNIIAKPRGLPEDLELIDEEYVDVKGGGQEDDLFWLGYHSHSYLHLEDFENFDWNMPSMKTGVITLEQYKQLRGSNESPSDYSGSVHGQNIVTVSMEKADRFLDEEEEIPNGAEIYVQYNWSIVYSSWFEYDLKSWVEPMRKLKEKYEDVRVVFGFDS